MDLSFLKDEFCFATNRIYLGFEKWDFVPTYYVSVNSLVIAQSAQEIQQIPCPKFISVVGIPNLQPQEDLIFINTVTCKDAFSETPENGFNIGATVTYVAMQLAYYMGFETVILIGVDHYFETKGTPHKAVVSQGEDPNHFHPSYFGKGVRWQLPDLPASEKMYQIAEQHYQQNNRQIIDATVDGHCPIFPKQNYQELFYNNREQFPIESNERELAPSFLNRLYRDIYFYQKHPNETTVISRLRQKRWELAQKWLNLQPSELENAYQGDLGRANKVFLNSGVLLEARTDEENSFVKNISAQIQETIDGESVIQFFLATCTYGYAYQLNLLIDVEHIPQWLLADYIKLVFVSPLFATEKGDIASYKEYIKYSIDKIYRYIKDYEEIKGQKWQTILDAFVSVFHVKHLLASPDDLKEITDKRAELIQIYIEQQCNSSLECDVLSIPEERQKIRVGILARSFAPNKEIFTSLPIYRYLNRDDFEIVLLKPQKTYHRIEKYCEGNADRSILLSGSIATQAEIVRQLDIDILWIAGDIVTGNADELSLLAAHRLARIQFVDANSPVTTGLPYIDYSILSSWVGSKQEFQPHYTEHLLPLDAPPHCIDLATEEKAKPSISITRDALGIQEDCIVYIAEVDYYTLIPELVETWAKIVARVPKSILLLYPVPTELPPYISTDNIHHTISGSFQKYCNESERLIFLDAVSSRADLQEYLKLGDIYLDSYVQSDIYSLTSPLQVGLPTVVYEGNTPRSRQSSSLLKSLQMEELVASNKEDYIQLAVSLGTNEAVRREKSNHITQRMREHPLVFDTRAYSDCIESVFHEVFHSYLAKELKQSFNLRNNNLIVFPDWNQPEDWLYEHLGNIIDQLARRTDKETTTLLIEASDISEEDANLIISGIAMNLLMEEELDVEAGPDISIVTKLGKLYWQALRSQLQARILLEHENQEAIAEASADLLPICTIDSLNEN
jgi:predicted O-linked N-acetylglucosamine transferase (SPINDLY family)